MTENIYDRAAELIQDYGWKQGGFGSKENGFCALGAVHEARVEAGMEDPFNPRTTRQLPVLAAQLPEDFLHVAHYNDHPNTTKEDILLLLKKAANHSG